MGQISRTEAIMSVKDLKERFLLGIDLRLDNGDPYPPEFFEYNIKSAISILEHDLDIFITPVSKDMEEDFRSPNYMNWNYIQLDHYPILSVEKWSVIFPSDNELVTYPNTWIKIDHDKGVLRLFPDIGSIPYWMVASGAYVPQLMLGKQHLPHFYKIEYTAGFSHDAVPIIINETIGLIAAMLPLDIAGDLIIGAGIASQSIGLDGSSQSIGTTSSAMYSGYSARSMQFQKRLKENLKRLRDYYKGIIFDSI